jgi:hypothetical protein
LCAVLEGYKTEAAWANNNPQKMTALLAQSSGWKAPVIDKIASDKSQLTFSAPDDAQAFALQRAADWLTAPKVLPAKVDVAKHIAKL